MFVRRDFNLLCDFSDNGNISNTAVVSVVSRMMLNNEVVILISTVTSFLAQI